METFLYDCCCWTIFDILSPWLLGALDVLKIQKSLKIPRTCFMIFFEGLSHLAPFFLGLSHSYKNQERIGVHDGICDRSPNQLLAKLTAH